MALELAKAMVSVRGDTSRVAGDLRRGQGRISAAARGIASSVSGIFAALGIGTGVVALARLGKAAVNFEATMIDVRANARLLGEEGAAAFTELEKKAREMGATTQFTAVQAAEALNKLVLGGLSAAEAMAALPAVLNTAVASNLQLAESAKIVVNEMQRYGLAAEDTAKIGDVLSSAQSRAQITAAELAQGLASLGSLGSSVGAEFEDVAAILTGMGKAGEEMSQAGTALAMGLARMIDKTGPAAGALEELGVNIRDFQGPGGALDLVALFRKLSDSMPTDPIEAGAKAIEIFGIKGKRMLGILNIMKKGRFVEDVRRGFEDDIGRSATIAGAKMDTFRGTILKLKSAIGELAIAGFTPILKGMEGFFNMIRKVVTALSKFREGMSQTQVSIVKATAAVVGFTIVLRTLRLTVIGVAIAIAKSLIATGIGALFVAAGIAVLGIIKLIKWLVNLDAIQKAFARNAAKFRRAWELVVGVFNKLGDAIAKAFKEILERFAFLENLPDTITGFITLAIDAIAEFVLDTAEWLDVFVSNWDTSWKLIKTLAKASMFIIRDIVRNVFEAIPVLVAAAFKATGAFIRAWGLDQTKQFTNWLEGVAIVVKGMVNLFKTAFSLVSTISGVALKAIGKAMAALPGVSKAASKEARKLFEEGAGNAASPFEKAMKTFKEETEDLDLFGLSPEAKAELEKARKLFDELAQKKRELEGKRVEKKKEDELGPAKESPPPPVAGPGKVPREPFEGRRLEFPELGKFLQDQLLQKQDPQVQEQQRTNQILERIDNRDRVEAERADRPIAGQVLV